MFQGETAITIDDKGRLTIPTAHREQVAEACGNRLVITITTVDAEDRRHHRGGADVGDPAGEARDIGRDPRHLGDHDDRRPGALAVHGACGAAERQALGGEVVQRIVREQPDSAVLALRKMLAQPAPTREVA